MWRWGAGGGGGGGEDGEDGDDGDDGNDGNDDGVTATMVPMHPGFRSQAATSLVLCAVCGQAPLVGAPLVFPHAQFVTR